MPRVAIVYHSGFGHTKLQAEAVEHGAVSMEGVETLLLSAEDASMQQGMIFVNLGLHPAASAPDSMNRIEGPGPEVTNRVGSYIGPMASSFQVNAGDALSKGDLATAEANGRRVASITQQLVRGRSVG